jgi:hypothetical protein
MSDNELAVTIVLAGMAMIIVLAIGIPLVRGFVKRAERRHAPPLADESAPRLERIEQAIDAMAMEIERIAEGQRFVTKLLADRQPERVPILAGGEPVNVMPNERSVR